MAKNKYESDPLVLSVAGAGAAAAAVDDGYDVTIPELLETLHISRNTVHRGVRPICHRVFVPPLKAAYELEGRENLSRGGLLYYRPDVDALVASGTVTRRILSVDPASVPAGVAAAPDVEDAADLGKGGNKRSGVSWIPIGDRAPSTLRELDEQGWIPAGVAAERFGSDEIAARMIWATGAARLEIKLAGRSRKVFYRFDAGDAMVDHGMCRLAADRLSRSTMAALISCGAVRLL